MTGLDATGARAIIRPPELDLFRLGTREAWDEGIGPASAPEASDPSTSLDRRHPGERRPAGEEPPGPGRPARARRGRRPRRTVALAAATGAHLVVVTSARWDFGGAELIADPGTGLMDAVRAGIEGRSRPSRGAPGRPPGPRSRRAHRGSGSHQAHTLAFVADADGTGTALATALDGREHRLAFGADSACAPHRRLRAARRRLARPTA